MDLNLPEKRTFIGPATLWKRIVAFLLDLFIIDFFMLSPFRSIAAMLLGNPASVTETYNLVQHNATAANSVMLVFAMIILFTTAYFVLMQYATGQTIGCIMMNIMVVTQTSEKEFGRAGFWQCLVRNLFIIPAIPFILLWVADPVYYLFAKKGQRLTEWLSNTKVIEQFEG